MYVGKRTKSILTVLLICGLLVVSVPGRAYAIGPVVLGPALKYAIGAGIVASGLYAADSDSLNGVINDYWSECTDHVKQQWQSAVIYGTGVGIILLNDPLKGSLKRYLDENYESGSHTKEGTVITEPVVEGGEYNKITIGESEMYIMLAKVSTGYYYIRAIMDGKLRCSCPVGNDKVTAHELFAGAYLALIDGVIFLVVPGIGFMDVAYSGGFTGGIGERIAGPDITYEGDGSGFGNATEGKPDVKIPCPPVPAAEWPDQWLDDLQDEMNRTGNPTLDDETSIEEWEDEYEWYLDQFGNIYKVKKGDPPRDPGDEKKMVPGPPLPAPNVPENYPTEDDPDLTIEHHPPQVERVENPDGSTTETTTQTTTTTKKWWDPSSQRWRTTTTDTTTTTTVDLAPDGTETGRTTTTTTQPKGEREETAQPDDTAIDWEPLRRMLYELTEKFPFCLPWDLMRGIQSLEASQWDRKIRIDVGDGLWPVMVIDLTMFDDIASITRVILLVIFDLGLVFGTRKLMGGDV